MNLGKQSIKARLLVAVVSLLMVFGNVATPLSGAFNVYAEGEISVDSWTALREAVEDGNASTINVTKDFVAEGGKTIEVNRTVTIQGSATIYRDAKAGSYEPMFTVANGGNLTIGDNIKLSGRTATCEGETITPAVTEQTGTETVTYWEKHPSDETFDKVVGKRVMLGFGDVDRTDLDNGKPIYEPGVAYIYGDDRLFMQRDENVFDIRDGKHYLKETLSEDDYVFTLTDLEEVELSIDVAWNKATYQAVYFEANDGRVIGRPTGGILAPVKMVAKDAVGANKIANNVGDATWTFMFAIGGLETTTEKFIFPNEKEANPVVIGSRSTVQYYQTANDNRERTYLWVETEETQETTYWTVEGTDEHFATKAEADKWASDHATTTPGDCTAQGCDDGSENIVTGSKFNGARGAEKGFFVQVNGGTFNLTGKAELRDLITDKTVTYAAPVVVNGGNFSMTGGSIEHNSVGYSADNSKSGDSAKNIGKEKEDGQYGEKGYIGEWENTETAGAIIFTGKSAGTISGGEIKDNRGDTGAILVQGKPDKQDATETGTIESGSSLDISGGSIDNNVGIHHAGAIYIFNGADVKMTAGKITNNFSWNKGGAIWVSEEAYASVLWNQNPNYTGPHMKSVGYAGFTMDGGEISGNMTVNRGGAINVMSNHVKLINGVIKNNSSRVLGGAIYVEGDGTDRMYTMVVNKGCIAGNTAYTKANAQNGTLNRTFGDAPSNPCDFVNDITAGGSTTSNGDVTHSADFGGYNGYGGGIWMCSFGGNATFNASDNFDVKVDGNTAQNRGQDLHVHVLKGGSTNGVNIMKLGNNNFYKEGTNIKLQANQNYQGIISIVNEDSMTTCPDGGVIIEGNQATVGGGIATNGTVIFGDDVNVYEVATNLKLKKVWEEEPAEGTKVNLKLYVKYNGERVAITDGYDPLEGYEITLNGKPDTKFDTEPGEDQYNENAGVWESDKYEANIGLPLSAVLKDGTIVPLFTFDVPGYDHPLDPTDQGDLAIIYDLANKKTLTAENAVIADWNIEVVETIDGEEVTHVLPLGEYVVEDVTALPGNIRDYKDRTGTVLTRYGTFPIKMGFATEILNTSGDVEVEKYINNEVHQTLEFFDKPFEYSIMAYVPMDATEITISDTLEEPLEFVDYAGKRQSEDGFNKQLITNSSGSGYDLVYVTKEQLESKGLDLHKGDGNGAVSIHSDKSFFSPKEMRPQHLNAALSNVTISDNGKGQTVSVTIDENSGLTDALRGNWVIFSFDAAYKEGFFDLTKVQDHDSWLEKEDNKSGQLDYVKENAVVKARGTDRPYVMKLGEKYYLSAVGDGHGKTWAEIPESDPDGWIASYNNGGLGTTISADKITGVEGIYAYNGTVVEADPAHQGTENQATYTVRAGEKPASEYKTNIVTVEAPMVEYQAEKKWLHQNGNENISGGQKIWPTDDNNNPAKITFTLWKVAVDGSTEEQIGEAKELTNFETVTFDEVPKLEKYKYVIREEVEGIASKLISDEEPEDKESGVIKHLFTNQLSDEPEVEKYVNNKVHANLENFDEVFEYSIVAYVPSDATELTITDKLAGDLLFVDANGKVQGEEGFDKDKVVVNQRGFHGLVIEGSSNNHNGNGTGTVTGHNKEWFDNNPGRLLTDIIESGGVTVDASSKTVTVKISEAMIDAHAQATYKGVKDNDMRGKNVILSFKAVIDPKSYDKVAEQIAKTDADSGTVDGLNWQKVTDDKSSLDSTGESHSEVKNGKDVESDGSHAGLANKANYKVTTTSVGEYDYDTNTVTVKPKTTKVEVSKEWKTGETVDTWPAGAEVEVKITQTKDGQTIDVEGKTDKLTANKTSVVFEDLLCLEGVTYGVAEGEVTNAGLYVIGEVEEVETGVFKITNKKETPEIEKYVNKKSDEGTAKDGGVHTDLEAFDEVYTYDIQAYIAKDATVAEVTDELQKVLEFVGEASSVKVVVKEGEADGKAPKLSNAGTAPEDAYTVDPTEWAKGKLVLTLGDAEGTEILKSAGMWIQITFDAKIKDDYRSIEALKAAGANVWTEILDNEPIDDATVDESHSGATAAAHEGIVNDSSYRMKKAGFDTGNNWTYKDDSNKVTVQPKTTKVEVSKVWVFDGQELTADQWPEGATVEVKLTQTKDGKTTEVEGKVDTLSADKQTVTFDDLAVLEGVTYGVAEGTVTNAGLYTIGQVEKESEGVFKITNTGTTPDEKTYPVKFSKKEVGGDEIAGARIVVKDEDGKTVGEWTSTTASHELTLKPGKYTMEETVSPEGFKRVTTVMEFEVDENGKVTLLTTEVDGGGKVSVTGTDHIILEDAPVKVVINKTDLSGKEIEGALILVTGPNDYEETWVSKKDETMNLENLKPGTYYLKEVVAPEGYDKVTTVITFEVDKDGNVKVEDIREESGSGIKTWTEEELIQHIQVEDAPKPILSVSKVAQVEDGQRVAPGDEIDYLITVTNDGPGDAKDVEVVDLLGENLEYVSSNPKGIVTDDGIVWTVDVKAKSEKVIKVRCRVEEGATGSVSNSVELRNVQGDYMPDGGEDEVVLGIYDDEDKAPVKSANTGDNTHLYAWYAMLLLSILVIAAATFLRRRKNAK